MTRAVAVWAALVASAMACPVQAADDPTLGAAAQATRGEGPTSGPERPEPTFTTALASGRQVGDHLFVMPTLFAPPWVMTYFSFRQGLALAEVQLQDFAEGPAAETVRVGGLVQRLRMGFRVMPWLSFLVGMEAQLIAGASAKALVLQGVAIDGSFALGPLFEVYRNDAWGTLVTTSLRYQQVFGREILPTRAASLVMAAADTSEVPDAAQVRSTLRRLQKDLWIERSVRTGDLDLALTQRLHRNVGAVAVAQARLGGVAYDTEGEDTEATRVDARRALLSIALQLSAHALPWAPLAFSAEYRHRRTFDSFSADVSNLQRARHSIGGGISYAGRPSLVLGLFTTYRLGRLAGQQRDSVFAELLFDYVFR